MILEEGKNNNFITLSKEEALLLIHQLSYQLLNDDCNLKTSGYLINDKRTSIFTIEEDEYLEYLIEARKRKFKI